MMLKKIFSVSIVATLLLLSACNALQPGYPIELRVVEFNKLPGWDVDHHAPAFSAFQDSCRSLLKMTNPPSPYDWQPVCQAALSTKNLADTQARHFFETWFTPYSINADQHLPGLFTGYYLPEIHATNKKTAYFSAPLYALPRTPHHFTRAAIDAGALAGKADIIAWATPLDRFFMQIQGSGLVIINHRKKILIGYSGNNGYAYTSIGKVLIARGELDRATLSMEKIRHWLEAHPAQAREVMEQDESFVFFKELPGKKPLGTLQIPLTPARSLAIDPAFMPLGAPFWVETTIPSAANPQQLIPLQQLFIAQDTGGAIHGIIRADLYWGPGVQAEYLASHMKNPGCYWLLLPNYWRLPRQ